MAKAQPQGQSRQPRQEGLDQVHLPDLFVGKAHEDVEADRLFPAGQKDICGIPDEKEHEASQHERDHLDQHVDIGFVPRSQNHKGIGGEDDLEVKEHQDGKGLGDDQG